MSASTPSAASVPPRLFRAIIHLFGLVLAFSLTEENDVSMVGSLEEGESQLSLVQFKAANGKVSNAGNPPLKIAELDEIDEIIESHSSKKAELNALKINTESPTPFLPQKVLSSKFYVYDHIDWMSMVCSGLPVSEVVMQEKVARKHTDDFWFLKAALKHPLRTMNPNEATLFVVPGLLNVVSHIMYGILAPDVRRQCCIGAICNEDLFRYAEDSLGKWFLFQRNSGKDHVMVCSHWACASHLQNITAFPNLNRVHSIAFEENSIRGERCRIASTYVGEACSHHAKQFMFTLVATMHPEKEDFRGRRDVCRWLSTGLQSTGLQNDPQLFSVCGTGDRCPALASARFGFHIRGDTWGSSRLIDLILSGTIPIFTSREQYEILPPFVPWHEISVFADISDQVSFESSIQNITERAHLQELQAAVNESAPLVDWETLHPFEQYMGLFEQCASM